MKKIGSFIKKNKKRIIVIIAVLFLLIGLVFWLGIRLGLIPLPKSVVLWYFNSNRASFDYIAEYVEENPETMIDIVYPNPEKMMRIEDEKLCDSIEMILKDRVFSSIFYCPPNNEGDREIYFLLSNFIVRKGDGVLIIYSEHVMQSGYEYVGNDVEYFYEYEHIDGNWYYKYRVR